MSRATMTAALVAQLQQCSGFNQTSQGTAVAYDESVLLGGVDHAVVVMPFRGDTELRAGRPGSGQRLIEHTWTLSCRVWVRMADQVTAWTDMDTYVGQIVDRIDANPTLGGSAHYAMVSQQKRDPRNDEVNLGALTYVLDELFIDVTEQVAQA